MQEEREILFNLHDEFDEEKDNNKIELRMSSKIAKLSFFQFLKYSQLIQEEYSCKEIINRLTQEIQEFQTNNKIQEESIEIFIKLLQDENITIKDDHYCDLCKLSAKFKIVPLQILLKKYAKNNSNNVDLILNLLTEIKMTTNDEIFNISEFSSNLENCLSNKIEKCLKNRKFEKLSISMVFRIIEKSDRQQIQSDLLFDFITKSIKDRYPLFSYLSIQNLSEEKFNEMHQLYIELKESDSQFFFQYLPFDLVYIKSLKDQNKKLIKENQQLNNKIDNLNQINDQLKSQKNQNENHIKKLEIENKQFINQIDNLNQENIKRENHIKKLETANSEIKNKADDLSKTINHLQNTIRNIEEEKKQFEVKNNQLNYQIKNLKSVKDKSSNQIKFSSSNEFKGIINYLRNLSNGNIDDEINISVSSVYKRNIQTKDRQPQTVTLFDDQDQAFFTQDEPNGWISFEFKNYKVTPTDYTIRTIKWWMNSVNHHPKNFVIEGSNDNNVWDLLDEENDCLYLNGPNRVHTFKMKKQSSRAYQYIRMLQTGKNWNNNYLFGLDSFEIYGTLISNKDL